jgi:hypothetical protein
VVIDKFINGGLLVTNFWFARAFSVVVLCLAQVQLVNAANVDQVAKTGGTSTSSRSALDGEQNSGGAVAQKNAESQVPKPSFQCHLVPNSNALCADTGEPTQKNVADFWQKLTSVIEHAHGYVSPEQFEHIFGINFAHIEDRGDGYRSAHYESGKSPPLSIQLDNYAPNTQIPWWQKAQGQPDGAWFSVLNIAGGDFGCVSLSDAEKTLIKVGLAVQQSTVDRFVGIDKSNIVMLNFRDNTQVTFYYDRLSVSAPCVISIRVIGHGHIR